RMNFWPLSLMALHSRSINDPDPKLRAGAGHMKTTDAGPIGYWALAGLFVNLQASCGEGFAQEPEEVLARDSLRPIEQQRDGARWLGAAVVGCNLLKQRHRHAPVDGLKSSCG